MILVRELSLVKGSRERRDWRQEVVTQRRAGRKHLPTGCVGEKDERGEKRKGKRKETESGYRSIKGVGMRRDAGSKALDGGERGRRAENEERDTKTGVVAVVHTSS